MKYPFEQSADADEKFDFFGTTAYQFFRWKLVEPILILTYKIGLNPIKPLTLYTSDELFGDMK